MSENIDVHFAGHTIKKAPTLSDVMKIKDIVDSVRFSVSINGAPDSLTILGIKQKGKVLEVQTYVTTEDKLSLMAAKVLLCTVYDNQGKAVIQIEYNVTNPQLDCLDLNYEKNQALVLSFKYNIVSVKATSAYNQDSE